MTEMFGEAWSPMSVPDLAPDDDDDDTSTYSPLHTDGPMKSGASKCINHVHDCMHTPIAQYRYNSLTYRNKI